MGARRAPDSASTPSPPTMFSSSFALFFRVTELFTELQQYRFTEVHLVNNTSLNGKRSLQARTRGPTTLYSTELQTHASGVGRAHTFTSHGFTSTFALSTCHAVENSESTTTPPRTGGGTGALRCSNAEGDAAWWATGPAARMRGVPRREGGGGPHRATSDTWAWSRGGPPRCAPRADGGAGSIERRRGAAAAARQARARRSQRRVPCGAAPPTRRGRTRNAAGAGSAPPARARSLSSRSEERRVGKECC